MGLRFLRNKSCFCDNMYTECQRLEEIRQVTLYIVEIKFSVTSHTASGHFGEKGYHMKKAILLLTLILAVFFCVYAAAETDAQEKVLYRIQSGDLYGYINRNGEVVVEPQYAIASLFDEYGYAAVKEPDGDEPGWCALLDWHGNVIARAPEIYHNEISYHLTFGEGGEPREGLFSPTTGTLIYYDGRILDDPVDDPHSTRVLVSPDNYHYGYLDRTTGEMAIPVQYDEVCIDWTQLSDPSGCHFIAYDFTCFHEGYAVVGQATGEFEYRMWLIDEQGKEIPLPGKPVTEVCEGKLNIRKDDDWYVCTVDGQILSDGYDEIRAYHNGYCGAINWRPHEPYEDSDGDYPEFVMLNEDGKEIYRHGGFFGHEKGCGFEVENGYYVIVEGSCGKFTEIYNVEQGLICTVPGDAEIIDFNRELIVVSFRDDPVIPHRYDNDFLYRLDGTPLLRLPYAACWNNIWGEKDDFSENYSKTPFYEDGLWLLCVDNSEGKRRYGYLNEEFSWHIQPQYICAEAFYHGLAWCTDEQGYDQYIDTQGRVVWKSSMPRDIEKEKAALDAAGTWYRTDADNITYWMFIGVTDWWNCHIASYADENWHTNFPGIEKLEEEYISIGANRTSLEEKYKRRDESVKEITSAWHSENDEEDDEYFFIFADGTYEIIAEDYDMMLADFGRIDGQKMISEMPGKTQRSNQVMRQENDLLTCVAPGIVIFTENEKDSMLFMKEPGWLNGWSDAILPVELQDWFILRKDGTWDYILEDENDDDYRETSTWTKEGNILTLETKNGTLITLYINEETGKIFYEGIARKTYRRLPMKTKDAYFGFYE